MIEGYYVEQFKRNFVECQGKNCKSCNADQPQICIYCPLGYILEEGNCLDCRDPEINSKKDSVCKTSQLFQIGNFDWRNPNNLTEPMYFLESQKKLVLKFIPEQQELLDRVVVRSNLKNFVDFYLIHATNNSNSVSELLANSKEKLKVTYSEIIRSLEGISTIVFYFNEFQLISADDYSHLLVQEQDPPIALFAGQQVTDSNTLILNRTSFKMRMYKDEDSINRNLIKDDGGKNPEDFDDQNTPVKSTLIKTVEDIGKVTLAVIIKYFQVVDLLINFVDKINVDIGPDLESKVDTLKDGQLPPIGFLEKIGISKDGGQDQIDSYNQKPRLLNDLAKPILDEAVHYFNDSKREQPIPEEFFKFLIVSKNTRVRLVESNKDLFIIFGQNGIIATLMTFSYLIIWLLNVGKTQKTVVKGIVFLQRQLIVAFFVQFQLTSFSELALHDIGRERQARYIYSYILSLITLSVINIELIRGWQISKTKNVDLEKLKEIDFEKGLIFKFWTSHLSEAEQKQGNPFMVKDRIRWSIFQLLIVGLQMNSVMQICLITIVDIVYLCFMMTEQAKKRVLKNFGLKLKYVFQEIAILVFLISLSIFSLTQKTNFKNTTSYKVLSMVILICVFVAIFSQILSVIWSIVDSIKDFIKSRKAKKQKELEKKFDLMEKEANLKLSDEYTGQPLVATQTLQKPSSQHLTNGPRQRQTNQELFNAQSLGQMVRREQSDGDSIQNIPEELQEDEEQNRLTKV